MALFCFYPQLDWQGEFICEDVANGWNSLLNLKVKDRCFFEYQKGGIQAVKNIDDANLSESHLKILREFQVQADLAVPVFKQDDTTEATLPQLWGLLCIHQCSSHRQWQNLEIEFAEKIAQHLGAVVTNTYLRESTHYQVQQQKALARVIRRIRTSLDLEEIFQVTAKEVRQLLKADRVAVFRFDPERDWEGEFVSEDVGTEWDSALTAKVYDYCFGEKFAPHYQEGCWLLIKILVLVTGKMKKLICWHKWEYS